MKNWIKYKNKTINLNNVFSYSSGSFEKLIDFQEDKSETVYCIQFDSAGKGSQRFEFESAQERDEFLTLLEDKINETSGDSVI